MSLSCSSRKAQSAALIIIAALALSGCTASEPQPEPTTAELRLHPHGTAGSWLDPAYAGGFAGAYVTMNTVCAVTPELSIEIEREVDGGSRVLAKSLHPGADGRAVWWIDDATCGSQALLPGDPDAAAAPARVDHLVVRHELSDDVWAWSLVDPASGTVGQSLPVPNSATAVKALDWVDGVLALEVDDRELVGASVFRGDGLDWREPSKAGETAPKVWDAALPGRAEVTVLADGMLGVKSVTGNEISVIDLSTGTTRFATAVPKPHWITWASDGYVQKVQETDPEYAYFDLDGNEVDRTKKVAQYRFVPGPEDGVTFPVAEHRAAGRVVGVDGSGRPTLFQDERQRDFTRAQQVDELPDSIISLQGVTLDGSRLLFGADPHGIVLIDDEGTEAASWPLPISETRVESGRIVLTGESGTWILRPAN